MEKGLRIVVIGGGMGFFIMFRGIKNLIVNIIVVVIVVDDGGGFGKFREDFGMFLSGDIRNCILVLVNIEEIM